MPELSTEEKKQQYLEQTMEQIDAQVKRFFDSHSVFFGADVDFKIVDEQSMLLNQRDLRLTIKIRCTGRD